MVLLQPQARNEVQDTELTTIKLTPNATSNFQTRFQIPRAGSVLDSNSSLVWRIEWAGYDANEGYQFVGLKQGSGGLCSLRRARFYIGGREIFSCQDVGHLIHIKRLARNPDYKEEMYDKEVGSMSGFYIGGNGKITAGWDASTTGDDRRFCRRLGSGVLGIECSVQLSDIFSALESLSLPCDLESMRLEIDWETNFDEVACIYQEGDGTGGQVAITNKTINITNPVLLLDYLTFNEELRAGLTQTLQDGMVIPYAHTSLSTKVLPLHNVATSRTSDVLLALQGKLLMKMYVSHRWADTINGNLQSYAKLQGRCRSQIGKAFSYNLYINDLALHDQPVDTDSMQYSFLDMALQNPVSIPAGGFAYNSTWNAVVDNSDVCEGVIPFAGTTMPSGAANTTGLSGRECRDGIMGTQGYIGFDLAKYDDGSRVVPSNAGYRCGSSAVIFRVTQTGNVNENTPEAQPKTIQVFTEEVKVMQVRGGVVDVFDA